MGAVTATRIEQLTPERLGAASSVYVEAFRSTSSGRLGRGYARAFLRWFMSEPDAIALVGLQGDSVVAFAVGAPLGYQRRLNRDLAGAVAAAILARPRLWFDRGIAHAVWGRVRALFGSSVAAAQPRVPTPTMCFVGAGLADRARGAGLGRLLYLSFQEETARRGDARSLRGIVHRDNQASHRILRRLGWQPLFEDAHGYVSWYKVLSPEPTTESLSSPDEPGKAGS